MMIILFIITLAVLIHYDFLYRITTIIPQMKIKHRFRIVFGVFGALIVHIIEVMLFAATYYLLVKTLALAVRLKNIEDFSVKMMRFFTLMAKHTY